MALTDKLTAIANAIRGKTGGSGSLTLDQMPAAISGIVTGITPTGTVAITENGTYDVTAYASAEVAVSDPNHRRYVVTNPSAVSGSGKYMTAVSADAVLAAVRDKQSLVVMYTTDGTVSCAGSGLAANVLSKLPIVGTTQYYQAVCRWSDAGAVSLGGVSYAISSEATLTSGTGRVHITSAGDLRIYANSSTYAIPAGTICIDVLWGDD